MSSSRTALVSAPVVAFIATGLFAAQITDTHTTIEQRIQDSLLPPVLINGRSLSSQTRKLADRMQELHVPGASVAVIHQGKIERAQGFGVTKAGGAAVTSETLFQAASISKPVTAMAVLRLVESGKLNLDHDVNEYLKTWKVPENEFTDKKKVTLRELLSHTAGTTVHGFGGYASGEQLPTLVQVLNGEKPANSPPIRVDVEPATIWRYSGGGYVITQQLLEDVAGKPFPQIMHELVLDPIGMKQHLRTAAPACPDGGGGNSLRSQRSADSRRAACLSGNGTRRPVDYGFGSCPLCPGDTKRVVRQVEPRALHYHGASNASSGDGRLGFGPTSRRQGTSVIRTWWLE